MTRLSLRLLPLLSLPLLAPAQTAWVLEKPASSPPTLSGHAMAYDAARRQIVLFGGIQYPSAGPGTAIDQTWVWDGSNWTHSSPANSPSPRSGHAMAYDAMHQQVLLFGGVDASGATLADSWVWDGSNWTQKSPLNSPSPRGGHSMTYDAARRQVVVFGGSTGTTSSTGLLSDTWIWDGATWTQLSPVSSPSIRSGASMDYDATHGQVVLFGGFGLTMGVSGPFLFYLSDTWTWDGTNWSQKFPATSPPPRSDAALAYNGSGVLLYGGFVQSQQGVLGDTWVWDGTNWSGATPFGPQSRGSTAMAYDAARSNDVLFGGYGLHNLNFSFVFNDTWVFTSQTVQLNATPNPSTFGQPVSLTATVAPSSATGVVTFYNGTAILGSVPVIAGTARLTTITLPPGVNSLQAYYLGDAANSPIRSPAITQNVTAVPGSTFIASPSGPVPVGTGPFAAVVADFNGDNKADIAVANAAGHSISVLLGDGNGGFSPAPGSPFQTGNGPFSLAAGDFNSDGIADLAVANTANSTITILLGNGSGGFTPANGSPFATQSGPTPIVVGDFNGDGKADIAVASVGGAVLFLDLGAYSVFLGNGDGSFTPMPIQPNGENDLFVSPTYMVVADFNGDGLPDLAVSGASGVQFLIGAGSGFFANNLPSFPGAGIYPVSLAAGKFQGGANPDLAIADLASNNVAVLLQTGSLESPPHPFAPFPFVPSPSSPFPTGASPESIAAGDFNGDGKLDLAVANSDSNNVTILLGDGTGNFTPAPNSPVAAGSAPFFVAVGDFNGDGIADLAVVNYLSGNVSVLLGH